MSFLNESDRGKNLPRFKVRLKRSERIILERVLPTIKKKWVGGKWNFSEGDMPSLVDGALLVASHRWVNEDLAEVAALSEGVFGKELKRFHVWLGFRKDKNFIGEVRSNSRLQAVSESFVEFRDRYEELSQGIVDEEVIVKEL